MKITKLQLEKIIQEEIENVLEERSEFYDGISWHSSPGTAKEKRDAYIHRMKAKRAKITPGRPAYNPAAPVSDPGFKKRDEYVRNMKLSRSYPLQRQAILSQVKQQSVPVESGWTPGEEYMRNSDAYIKVERPLPKEEKLYSGTLDEGELDENAITEETDIERAKRQFREKQGRDYAKLIFDHFHMNKYPDMPGDEFMKQKKKAIGNVDAGFVQNPPDEMTLQSNPGLKAQFEAFKEEYMRLQLDAAAKGIPTDPQLGAPDYFLDIETGRVVDVSRDTDFRRRMKLADEPWYEKSSTDASSSKGKKTTKTTDQAQPTKAKATKSRGSRPSLPSNWRELPINDPSRVAYRNWKKGISAEPEEEEDWTIDAQADIDARRKGAKERRKKFLATATPEQLAKDKAALAQIGLTSGTRANLDVATSKKSLAKKTAKEKVPASADGKLNLKLKDPSLSTNFISEPDKFDPIFTKKMRFRNLPPKAASSAKQLREERSYIKKIIEEVYDEVLAEEGWFEPHI